MARARTIPLREELARLAELVESAGGGVPRAGRECFSCGCAALDGLLPGGGLTRGSIVEWLSAGSGGGAGQFAVVAAREAQRSRLAQGGGGAVVVVDRKDARKGDRNQGFYPPTAAAWGLDLASMIVVHPASEADERWALDQALRCEHVAAVVAWPRRLDGRTFRRLQLAAEASGAVGLLVRPPEARREPSWAHVRWAVTPRTAADGGWRLAVELLRVRGGSIDRSDRTGGLPQVVIEIDPTSGEFHEASAGDLAAELAGAAAGPSPA